MTHTDKITIKCECPICNFRFEHDQELEITTRFDEPEDIHIKPIDPDLEILCKNIAY